MSDSRPSARNREPGARIGVMNCWSCKREIPVKRMPSKKLSIACTWCDFPHYANEGTEHCKNVLAATRLDPPAADPAPAPPPARDPDPPPAEDPPAPSPKPRTGPLFGRK